MPYELKPIPIEVVGSSKFGIYPKINSERTYNMFISDGWLINYAGYRRMSDTINGSEGRGLFHSIRGDFLIAVVDDKVWRMSRFLGATQVGTLNTRRGEVFMDENLSSQICIVDGQNGYIYNYDLDNFATQSLSVDGGAFNLVPGYVAYHNSFFLIAPSINDPNDTNDWYAFQADVGNLENIVHVPFSTFPLQTKPDVCLAVKRLPGKANHVLVLGSSVCEVFTNVGGEENYRRNASFNIDSGCVARSTIASNDQFICFLAQNENNEPSILFTDGSSIQRISTDGIDHLLQTIEHPEDSTAFFYWQNGHLFYQITFFNDDDNLSLVYDFKEQKFYHVSDHEYHYHPARQIAYFNKRTIFIGLNQGSLFELSTDIDGAFLEVDSEEGHTIPRVRITNTTRMPSSQPFFCNALEIWMEQGIDSFPKMYLSQEEICYGAMVTEDGDEMVTEGDDKMLTEDGSCSSAPIRPRVDLQMSKTGNVSFSNVVGKELNPTGDYRNRLRWHRLGFANEITFQMKFWGMNRFIVNNALLKVGQ